MFKEELARKYFSVLTDNINRGRKKREAIERKKREGNKVTYKVKVSSPDLLQILIKAGGYSQSYAELYKYLFEELDTIDDVFEYSSVSEKDTRVQSSMTSVKKKYIEETKNRFDYLRKVSLMEHIYGFILWTINDFEKGEKSELIKTPADRKIAIAFGIFHDIGKLTPLMKLNGIDAGDSHEKKSLQYYEILVARMGGDLKDEPYLFLHTLLQKHVGVEELSKNATKEEIETSVRLREAQKEPDRYIAICENIDAKMRVHEKARVVKEERKATLKF